MIIGSDEYRKGDEHIELIRYQLSKTEHIMTKKELSERAILLGDGAADMRLAKRHDITAIGITNTINIVDLISAGAGKVISSFNEVEPFF
jgi:phosphoglycolate phosphatase-like HAD superfamily hydrolase